MNLALVVWFYSFVAALLALGDPGRPSLLARHSIVIAGAGVVAMLAGDAAALPDSVRYGLRAAAVALALAAMTFAVSAFRQPAGLAPEAQFELLVWGVGHVLQLVCVLAMVSVWCCCWHRPWASRRSARPPPWCSSSRSPRRGRSRRSWLSRAEPQAARAVASRN